MTALAPDAETIRELDAGTQRAWSTYREGLRALAGEEYERVESTSWDELQSELRSLERRRRSLRSSAA